MISESFRVRLGPSWPIVDLLDLAERYEIGFQLLAQLTRALELIWDGFSTCFCRSFGGGLRAVVQLQGGLIMESEDYRKKHIIVGIPTNPSLINLYLSKENNINYQVYGVNWGDSFTLTEINKTTDHDQFDRLVYMISKKESQK